MHNGHKRPRWLPTVRTSVTDPSENISTAWVTASRENTGAKPASLVFQRRDRFGQWAGVACPAACARNAQSAQSAHPCAARADACSVVTSGAAMTTGARMDGPPGPGILGTAAARTRQTASRLLVPVFLVVLLDFIGFGLIIPLLPLWAKRLSASPSGVGLVL